MKYLPIFILSLAFNACNGQQLQKAQNQDAISSKTFEMVSVPDLLTEPEKRAEYLAIHYWDNFDFTDTAYVHLPEVTEQALVNYIDVMNYVSPEVAHKALTSMMKKAEADSTLFAYFSEMYEKYLYEGNSPLRNDELFIPILKVIVNSPILNEADKIRPTHLLEMTLKNRPGEPAADFTYTTADGKEGKLYGITGDYLLVYFYDPDCHNCHEVIEQLKASAIVNKFIDRKGSDASLKILAVYTNEDFESWRNHLPSMPTTWMNVYDATVSLKNDEVYDLKALPCMYLLNKEKKVLLKDLTFQQLENYLQQIQ